MPWVCLDPVQFCCSSSSPSPVLFTTHIELGTPINGALFEARSSLWARMPRCFSPSLFLTLFLFLDLMFFSAYWSYYVSVYGLSFFSLYWGLSDSTLMVREYNRAELTVLSFFHYSGKALISLFFFSLSNGLSGFQFSAFWLVKSFFSPWILTIL